MNTARARLILWGWVREVRQLPKLLDWALAVVEPLVALGFACAVFYLGSRVVFGTASEDERRLIKDVSENWKIAVVVLVPLFYRTVRIFLEEVVEAAGMKRRPRQEIREDEEASPVRPPAR